MIQESENEYMTEWRDVKGVLKNTVFKKQNTYNKVTISYEDNRRY